MWTFCSSSGVKLQIHFTFHSHKVAMLASYATNCLDLGSDHRAVFASAQLSPKPRIQRPRRCNNKGWRPHAPNNGGEGVYHAALQQQLDNERPQTIQQLEQTVLKAKEKCDKQRCKVNMSPAELWQRPDISFLQQPKRNRSQEGNTRFSKLIRKNRQFLRAKRNMNLETITGFYRLLDSTH